jgi:hypothetical protein
VSVKVMSAVWDREDLDASERLVMLSLADHADDEGVCYPSIARLCKRTSMSDRGVQKVLVRLQERGFLRVEIGAGRSGSNRYFVNATPEPSSPPNYVHPRTVDTTPPNPVRKTPEPGSPKPSRTINETSDSISAREVASVLAVHASPQAVASFMAYRRKSKGKALTLTAAKRLANNLRAIAERGGDPDDALGMAEERVWLTVEPDWYFNSQGKQHGNGSRNVSQDPTLRAIFAAAGAFKA